MVDVLQRGWCRAVSKSEICLCPFLALAKLRQPRFAGDDGLIDRAEEDVVGLRVFYLCALCILLCVCVYVYMFVFKLYIYVCVCVFL